MHGPFFCFSDYKFSYFCEKPLTSLINLWMTWMKSLLSQIRPGFGQVPLLNPPFSKIVDHLLCYLIGPQDISLSLCHNFHQHCDNFCLNRIFMSNHTERTQCSPLFVFCLVGIFVLCGAELYYKLPFFYLFLSSYRPQLFLIKFPTALEM